MLSYGLAFLEFRKDSLLPNTYMLSLISFIQITIFTMYFLFLRVYSEGIQTMYKYNLIFMKLSVQWGHNETHINLLWGRTGHNQCHIRHIHVG